MKPEGNLIINKSAKSDGAAELAAIRQIKCKMRDALARAELKITATIKRYRESR